MIELRLNDSEYMPNYYSYFQYGGNYEDLISARPISTVIGLQNLKDQPIPGLEIDLSNSMKW